MKKKLLMVALMAAMLVCLLVVGVSAAGAQSDEYGEITIINGVSEPSIIDASSKVVILASDGTYYTFPAYYILEDNKTFRWKSNAEVSNILGYSQSAANNDFRPYVVRIEIPNGIEEINPGSEGGAFAFEDARKLIEATIPESMTIIGNYSFNRAYSLATLNGFEGFLKRGTKLGKMMLAETAWGTGIDLVIPQQFTSLPEYCFYNTKIQSVVFPETLKTIEQRVFQGCPNITSVKLPASITYMKNHVFASCSSLNSIDMSACVNLQEIGEYCFESTKITSFDFTSFATTLKTIGIGLFNNCSKMTTVISYEKVDCATTVGNNMFNGCPLTEIKLPKNITSIGSMAFYHHKSTQSELRIPNGVTTIGNHAFARNGQDGAAGLKIYLPANLTTITNDYTFENWRYREMYIPASLERVIKGFCNNTLQTGVVYYFTGDKNSLIIDDTQNHNAAMSNAEWISVDDFKGASSTKNYIVYGYNHCDAFYNGQHVFGDELTPVFGENGKFISDCALNGVCAREQCAKTAVKETLAPLFSFLGFSKQEYSSGAVLQSFAVNNSVLDRYTEMFGGDLHFGILVGVDKLDVTNEEEESRFDGILYENGDFKDKVITVDFTDKKYDIFEMKITGLGNYKNASVYLSAYVIVNNEINYLHNGSISEFASSFTYDSIG